MPDARGHRSTGRKSLRRRFLLGGAGACRPANGSHRAWLNWWRSRRFGELDIDQDTAALLAGMSAATIDRRLAPERRTHELKDAATPSRLAAQKPDPGAHLGGLGRRGARFVEIDLVGHDGGNPTGEHAFTLTVTDIATGWTENRSVRNKARQMGAGRPRRHRPRDTIPDPGRRFR